MTRTFEEFYHCTILQGYKCPTLAQKDHILLQLVEFPIAQLHTTALFAQQILSTSKAMVMIALAPCTANRRIDCHPKLWQTAFLTPIQLSWQGVATHVVSLEGTGSICAAFSTCTPVPVSIQKGLLCLTYNG